MITIRRTQTQQELKKYAQICHQLTAATMEGMILRFTLDNGTVVEGFLNRMQMDASQKTHGIYWGYVELLTEQNVLYMIDLLDVKEIQNITTKEVLRRYADKGVITVGEDLNA